MIFLFMVFPLCCSVFQPKADQPQAEIENLKSFNHTGSGSSSFSKSITISQPWREKTSWAGIQMGTGYFFVFQKSCLSPFRQLDSGSPPAFAGVGCNDA